jgi:uncharacterized protein (DUF433 family)
MIRDSIIERSEDVLGGTAVFKDTRVPVQTFLDHLKAGDTLDHFVTDFPTVSRERAVQVLELAGEALMSATHETPS